MVILARAGYCPKGPRALLLCSCPSCGPGRLRGQGKEPKGSPGEDLFLISSSSSFKLCFFWENEVPIVPWLSVGVKGNFPVFSLVLLHVSPDAGGMWSTAGCSVARSLPDSTACFCNHTTNFAILLQVYEMEVREEPGSGWCWHCQLG